MNWQPNTGEKPTGQVLIWVESKLHNGYMAVATYRSKYKQWYESDDVVNGFYYQDKHVTHWMKVEAPQ